MVNTPEDWWKLVNERWADLIQLIDRYHPAARLPSADEELNEMLQGKCLGITAKGPEAACEYVRQEIRKEEAGLDPVTARAERAKTEKDHEALGHIFSATWFGIPESTGAHSLNGFYALCDLCSENWVFDRRD